jgi:hypothetical protein
VQDEKSLNTQTGGAGGQGQTTKEESGVAPNLTEFAPLIDFATGSFERLNSLMAKILSDFHDENRAKLEMQKTQEERRITMQVETLLGAMGELYAIFTNLIWRKCNEPFFNDPASVRWFAKIVTKLAATFNNFEAGKVDYDNLPDVLDDIRLELQKFLFTAIRANQLCSSL